MIGNGIDRMGQLVRHEPVGKEINVFGKAGALEQRAGPGPGMGHQHRWRRIEPCHQAAAFLVEGKVHWSTIDDKPRVSNQVAAASTSACAASGSSMQSKKPKCPQ